MVVQQRHSWRDWINYAPPAVFFTFSFFYVWLRIDPKLMYYRGGLDMGYLPFLTGWSFFADCLSYPGGAVEYVAGFFSQCYYVSWLGALAITLTAALVYVLSRKLSQVAAGPASEIIALGAAFLVLLIPNRYGHQLPNCLALSIALLAFLAYQKLPVSNTVKRAAVFSLLFMAAYHIAAGASLFFVLLAASHELITRRRIALGCFCLLFGLVLPYLTGTYIFHLCIPEAYLRLLPFPPDRELQGRTLMRALYALLIAVALAGIAWKRLTASNTASRKPHSESTSKPTWAAKLSTLHTHGTLGWVPQTVVCLVAISALILTFDSHAKKPLQLNCFARNRMWSDVLETAPQIAPESYKIFCVHDVNRALYHTGRLGDDMFSYPQHPDGLLRTKPYDTPLGTLRASATLIELGNVNCAEKDCYELLEVKKNCPYVAQQLALINMVKGQIETARVFLNALRKDLVYGRWARNMLRRLDEDPQLANDKEIRDLRAHKYVGDAAFCHDERFLPHQVAVKGRPNRMAFEYLMSHYLLTRQLDKLIKNLHHLDDFDYDNIPSHYQEAIVLQMALTGKKINLRNRKLHAETASRWNTFSQTLESFADKPELARDRLAPAFGHSYFFYYFFRESGVTK